MKVLVDTSVWSLAFRRKAQDLNREERSCVAELERLILSRATALIGPIRQELLSGLREEAAFEKLRRTMWAFVDEPLVTADFEEAARVCNRCRARGVSGSSADFLICAVATDRGWEIFTRDADFAGYGRILPIRLYPAVSERPRRPS